jgi:hypothetical protein
MYALDRTHKNCKHGMKNIGTLVKSSLGLHVTNGVLNQPEIIIDPLGKNPRAATIDKFGAQSSLRISIQQARPSQS